MKNIQRFVYKHQGFEERSEDDKEDYTIKKTDSIIVGAKL